MAFTVEDGTGLADANALAALADVEAWLADRGLTAFAAKTDAEKQAAVVQATDYLSSAFAWKGDKLAADQALSLPTDCVAAGDDLPGAILQALSRIAFSVAVSGVQLFGAVSAQQGVQRVKAGPVEVQFADAAVRLGLAGRHDFPWLVELIGPYIAEPTGSVNRKVVRV